MQTLTKIMISVIGSQTFAEDMRYNVKVSVNVNPIDFLISNKQMSHLLYCIQHFYDYGLNIFKNGKKNYNFSKPI